MRRKLLIAALLVFVCSFVILMGAAWHGAESMPAKVLEAAYPLWGQGYEYLYHEHLNRIDPPFLTVLSEIRGRRMAREAYRADIWHFWGTGMSSTLLVGLQEDDPPISSAPGLQRCEFDWTPYSIPEDPEEFERWERPDPLEHGELITCYLSNGRTVEFVGSVMSFPCIHEPWLDGFNRKMVELMVADGNWPPTDDDRRLSSFAKFAEVME